MRNSRQDKQVERYENDMVDTYCAWCVISMLYERKTAPYAGLNRCNRLRRRQRNSTTEHTQKIGHHLICAQPHIW